MNDNTIDVTNLVAMWSFYAEPIRRAHEKMAKECPELAKKAGAFGSPALTIIDDDDHSECCGYVSSEDQKGGELIHFAVECADGKVIAFEHIQQNRPATSMSIYRSRDDWRSHVTKVSWIGKGLKKWKK